MNKVLDVINACCCCLILMFVLTNNGRNHQSNSIDTFLLRYLLRRRSVCSYTNLFLKNTWVGGFLSDPHLVDNYAKNVDERGLNIMCDRLFVWIYSFSVLLFFYDHAIKVICYSTSLCKNITREPKSNTKRGP